MLLFKTSLEARIARKFKEIEQKVKNSFGFIREDIKGVQSSLESVKKHVKSWEKQYDYAKKEDSKIRAGFRKDVDEFSQKTKQLSLALERVKEIEKELVVKKELAQIEDKIKTAFRDEINNFREQEKDFKKHINDFNKRIVKIERAGLNAKPKQVKEKKRRWFGLFRREG